MARRFMIAAALAVLSICLLAEASLASAAKKRGCAHVSAVPRAASLPQSEDAILCLINEERAKRRVSTLRRSTELTQAARDHSTDMVSRQYFAHESLDGATPRERVLRSGYFRGSARGTVEEALAWGWGERSAPTALVTLLMDSAPHRSILLNRGVRDIGVGLVLGAPGMEGGATLTLDAGRR
jgi:uncharacterized protein YkwD